MNNLGKYESLKNKNSVEKELTKLLNWEYKRYLPTAFDNTFSLEQKLNQLIDSFNKLIDSFNAHRKDNGKAIIRGFKLINDNLEVQLNQFVDELEKQKDLYEEIRDKIHSELLPSSVREWLEEQLMNGNMEDFINNTVFVGLTERMEDFENRIDHEASKEVNIIDFEEFITYQENGNKDWSEPLKEAMKVSKNVKFPAGEFDISPTTLEPEHSGTNIYGSGKSTKINAIGGAYMFNLTGEAEPFKRVTQDYEVASKQLVLENTDGLKRNDILLLKSERNCLNNKDAGYHWILGNGTGSGDRPQQLAFGEFVKIEKVDGNTVHLFDDTIYPFYGATNDGQDYPVRQYSTVEKMNFVENVTIKDMDINVSRGFCFRSTFAKDCFFDNITCIDRNVDTVARGMCNITQSLNCEVSNCHHVINDNESFDDSNYWQQNPYKLTSAQYCGIVNCSSENAGQGVDISYSQTSIPSTGCYIKDFKSIDSKVSGLTTHGGNFLTQITGNFITGCRQGISHRGRGATITGNHIIGSDYWLEGTLRSGISLYQGGACDNIVSKNQIQKCGNGISYNDGGHNDGGRAHIINTIISDNVISNCIRPIFINRYQTNQNFIPKEEMNIIISGNIIKLFNGVTSSRVIGLQINERAKGITVKDNMFIGLEGEVGTDGGRVNNFHGVYIEPNCDKIVVVDNDFIDLDYSITHEGTTNPYTENVFPDGVDFYEKDNRYNRVRLGLNYSDMINLTAHEFMVANLTAPEFSTNRTKINFSRVRGNRLIDKNDNTKIILNKGMWAINYSVRVLGNNEDNISSVKTEVKINGAERGNLLSVNNNKVSNSTIVDLTRDNNELELDIRGAQEGEYRIDDLDYRSLIEIVKIKD